MTFSLQQMLGVILALLTLLGAIFAGGRAWENVLLRLDRLEQAQELIHGTSLWLKKE